MNFVSKFDADLPVDGPGAHPSAHAHVETVSPQAVHAPSDAIIVSDTQLLFNGDFKRSGVDLVISKDHHELVLHDYFKGEKRAALSSPDGAHLTGELVNALTGHVDYAQADGSASAGHIIGHVTKLTGSATAIRNGVSIILNNGDNVEKGDVVQAGSDSTLGITFIDGTVFGLSSNARMVLNEMVYDPNGSNNSSLLSLVAGTISFVAGETAKHGDMKIDTPVATMGIRGTAVLVEIDFTIPGQGGAPDAKFQVLVEPDGTTGSYILFDKNTMTPIATVNQAGQQFNISQGAVSITNFPLSPDAQKLIQQVFESKFTDNSTTPKTSNTQVGSSTPDTTQQNQTHLADNNNTNAAILNVLLKAATDAAAGAPTDSNHHVSIAPATLALSGGVTELAGKTGDFADKGGISGFVGFADINPGDQPTVTIDPAVTFKYLDATGANITANVTSSAQWLADVKGVEANLALVPDPGNNNIGTVAWTYSVADANFDFLAAGETLTLTYTAHVDNNYAPNPQTTDQQFSITITGTNDAPVITSAAESVAYSGGKTAPGGNLQTIGGAPTTGALAFTDVDLSDTHTVATALTNATLTGGRTLDEAALDALAPTPMAAFEQALSAIVAKDSTGTGSGTINWTLADLPVWMSDFINPGETLTLTYTVTVTDSQGAISTQNVVVTIASSATAAVVWIDTADMIAGDIAAGILPGDWNVGTHWGTGNVPTAAHGDDAYIITDQLSPLTPYYPVTINAAASANSLTMDDFESIPPVLDNNSTLTITGEFDLNTDSVVNNAATGSISVGGLMEVLGASVLSNKGAIDLASGGDFNGTSTITNFGSGIIEVSGGTLTARVGVSNAGTLEATSTGTIILSGETVTNTGTVEVVGSGATLNLESATISGGIVDNSGTLEATSGTSTISGTSSFTNNGTLEVLGAELDLVTTVVTNGNGAIIVDQPLPGAGGTLNLQAATINGGTVWTAGSTDVIEATSGGNFIDYASSIINAGTIEANGGTLTIDATVSFTNGGILEAVNGSLLVLDNTMVNNAGGTIEAVDPAQLAISTVNLQNATITGGVVATIYDGIIDAIGVNAIYGATIDNAGTLESTGGTLNIDATSIVNNTGTFEVNGGNLIVDAALSGITEIMGASLLELGANFTSAYSSANIIFASMATGTLVLDHSEVFNGTVSGLDDNRLDLRDITSGTNTTISYSGDSNGGTLTVLNNGDPTQIAHIHLTGDYLGSSWIATSDTNGGTSLTEVPGAIAGLNPHGDAVEGNAVTASITDGGQPVTNAMYQWQSDGQDILSATNATYLPTESDEGHALTVHISFVDALNHAETGTISAGTVEAVPPVITDTSGSASSVGVGSGVNLVTNGGFETGSFDGWSLSGNTGFSLVSSQDSHGAVYDAWLGPIGSDGHLTQDISTVAGQDYTLDFWLSNDGGVQNDFSVTWNGTTLFPQLVNQQSQPYTEYTFDVVGGGPSSALQFNFRQDPAYWHLDDVSVTSKDTAEGTIGFTDPNDTDTASVTADGTGYLGTFSLDPVNQVNGNGSVGWHFSATTGEIQQLLNPPGQPITQSYDVAIGDGHPGGTVVQKVGLTFGSSANDTFVFAPGIGQEMVFNFSQQAGNTDRIELDHFGISDFSQLNLQSVNNNHDTLVNLGHNDSLLLVGVIANNLHASEFILHA